MAANPRRRHSTSTSSFGVSRREAHDASAFYQRFTAPYVTADTEMSTRRAIDEVFCHDAREMPQLDDKSVALVVTSPPYFAGKEYETALGEGLVPASYHEYLTMLEEVFAECVRKLEPGGRIAVNVANLGRKPYRSLSADLIGILQDRLRLLLRGEVVWVKARGATGSCAWGSFQRPANPVLRDLTERVIVASNGRFDRAISARQRLVDGHPAEASISRDEFMEATTDVWEIGSESASRVGHPAPFPIELPERLIHLYTYRDDLVLDPFIGSGTTAVAALRTGRHFAGYDTDEAYVRRAKERIDAERLRRQVPSDDESTLRAALAAGLREGRSARGLAGQALVACGFSDITQDVSVGPGLTVDYGARDVQGRLWHFDVTGGFTSSRAGLTRNDTLWRALGKAAALREMRPDVPLVLLTSQLPTKGTAGEASLQVLVGPGKPVRDVIVLTHEDHLTRLRDLALAGDMLDGC